jgi:hypothetical protein
LAFRGRVNAGQQFQKRAFAGAVVAHDADPFALVEFQCQILKRTNFDEWID